MGAIESTVDRVRQPEYTGENRCYPCTVVNLAIALGIAAVVGGLLWGTGWALPAAVAVLAICCVPIALRGYLVPGTPALTKRYLPASVLELFGKEPPGPPTPEEPAGEPTELDIESALLSAGALQPEPEGEDLRLAPSIREEWRAEIETVREQELDRERLAEILGIPAAELTFQDFSESFRAFHDGHNVGTWESEAAYLADAAAAPVLAERIEQWADIAPPQRGQLLNGLRIFLESCPECDAALSFGTDTVESCCSTREVVALTCRGCEARLFESDPM